MADLTGSNDSPRKLSARLIQGLDRCYGELEEFGFAALRRRVGKRILDGAISGCVRLSFWTRSLPAGREASIEDGALLIEDDTGDSKVLIAGDVIPVET